MDTPKIMILSRPDYISWDDITGLLHRAFACHLQNGLTYSACTQTAEYTEKRVGNGICIVALLEDKLVGTATLHFKGKSAHLTQVATDPDYRQYRIGRQLQDYIFKYCKAENVGSLTADTAINAKKVVDWYLKSGWQKVGLRSYITTNYYSVVLRKPVCGRRYYVWEAGMYLNVLSFFCRLTKKENGEVRKWIRPVYDVYKLIKK
ncbi:MAG: GNAT family N-acetyltransferase [Odoribacter splanchnicus]